MLSLLHPQPAHLVILDGLAKSRDEEILKVAVPMEKDEEEERPSTSNRPELHISTENASDTPSAIRFLISNASAGSIIGKGGSTISEFQSQSGARIQLSRNREFFPGTTDRIILLSGTINSILTALHLILSKILTEESGGGDIAQKISQVKLIVPTPVCGGIIGKGGATIKSYVEDSNANIKLSAQDQGIPGVNDRLVTITGKLDQQMRAVALILSKMTEDPNYMIFANMPVAYATGSGGGGLSPGSPFPHGAYPMPMPVSPGAPHAIQYPTHRFIPAIPQLAAAAMVPMPGASASTIVAVPDEHIGAIVGRGGRAITEIQQMSGVRIKISDRGDFIVGTSNRKVAITGTAEGCQLAQFLISQKIQQNMQLEYSGGSSGDAP